MKCTPVESQETARKTDLGPLVYEACHAESITEEGYFTSVDIKESTSKNIRTRKNPIACGIFKVPVSANLPATHSSSGQMDRFVILTLG